MRTVRPFRPRRLESEAYRDRLITELATTRKTQAQLAREYGVGQPAISMFAARHRAEIERLKQEETVHG